LGIWNGKADNKRAAVISRDLLIVKLGFIRIAPLICCDNRREMRCHVSTMQNLNRLSGREARLTNRG
jgi:hypothetical protein